MLRLVETEHSDKLPMLTLAEFEEELPGYKSRHEPLAKIVQTLGKMHKQRIDSHALMVEAISKRSYPTAIRMERVMMILAGKSDEYVHRFAERLDQHERGLGGER